MKYYELSQFAIWFIFKKWDNRDTSTYGRHLVYGNLLVKLVKLSNMNDLEQIS